MNINPGRGGQLRAPFPYFGGKGRAAPLVWDRFGKVTNFVEPFAGSLAVLLACPEEHRPRVETVNDENAFLCNFWRATIWDPDGVARWADWPVNEVDLHSRHRWLLKMVALLRARLEANPMNYDSKIAGFWVWGASAWIGSGWCEEGVAPTLKMPSDGGRGALGLHARGMREPSRRLPDLAGGTQWGTADPNVRVGRGVHSASVRGPTIQLPDLSGGYGRGMGTHAPARRTRLYDVMRTLSERLRHVRVACGDWSRICTEAITYQHGLTGVFLDPPYEGFEGVYGKSEDDGTGPRESVAARARVWAIEMGERSDMRIALCGYEGEHTMPPTWECVAWKAKGGYSNVAKGGNNGNKDKERIWFSPSCLKPGRDVGQLTMHF